VLRDPAGEAFADADAEQLGLRVGPAHEHALERDRLAPAGVVVDAVHAQRVVGDQRPSLGDDRVADPAHVLHAAEAGRQIGDRAEPRSEVLHRGHEPGIPDGRCDRVPEAAGERRLLGRPVVRGVVIEHEQRHRDAAEDRGDEAQGDDVVGCVELAHLGRDRRVAGAVEHDDLLGPERLEAGELRLAGRSPDPTFDLGGELAAGDELERVFVGWMPEPEPGAIRVEETLGVLEDLLEDWLQGVGTGQLGGETAQGVGAGRPDDAEHGCCGVRGRRGPRGCGPRLRRGRHGRCRAGQAVGTVG
jgi:hypothetical protein